MTINLGSPQGLRDKTRKTPGELGRRRWRALPPSIALSIGFICLVVLCALAGSFIAPHPAGLENLITGVQGPSGMHWLGTDQFGRDILSRVIVGSRWAVMGPAIIAVGDLLIGDTLGLISGYRGGLVDAVIMRMTDLVWAFPALLIAIIVVGVLGGGYFVAVFVVLVLSFVVEARLIRGATLDQRSQPYVEAARLLGLSQRRIMMHIWLNVLPLSVANTFLNFAFALISLTGLSFLGLGVPVGTPDWGGMVSDNLSLLQSNPFAVLAPAVAIVLAATSMSLIGDWLYDLLSSRGRAR